MTCYSWYIATVPHLHHSLTTDDLVVDSSDKKYQWPKPLRRSYNLGLLPFVKRFRIRLIGLSSGRFASERLGGRTMRYFSALTNLRELGIDNLDIPSFMPNIRRYFEHISPTLRFLALMEPKGSCRQILYFVGLFQNLQDLKFVYFAHREIQENANDATLIPLSVPPLQGRLTLVCFAGEKLVKNMIVLFGGLRFSSMDLFKVKCGQLLLNACACTLEALRLYPSDPYSEELFRRDNVVGIQLMPTTHSERPGPTPTFQSVTEQVPPDTRDNGQICL